MASNKKLGERQIIEYALSNNNYFFCKATGEKNQQCTNTIRYKTRFFKADSDNRVATFTSNRFKSYKTIHNLACLKYQL